MVDEISQMITHKLKCIYISMVPNVNIMLDEKLQIHCICYQWKIHTIWSLQ